MNVTWNSPVGFPCSLRTQPANQNFGDAREISTKFVKGHWSSAIPSIESLCNLRLYTCFAHKSHDVIPLLWHASSLKLRIPDFSYSCTYWQSASLSYCSRSNSVLLLHYQQYIRSLKSLLHRKFWVGTARTENCRWLWYAEEKRCPGTSVWFCSI